MYLPASFAVDDPALVLALARSARLGHLVSVVDGTSSGLEATSLPFLIDDEMRSIRAHFSRANPHWRTIDRHSALFIVPVSDAYVSPRWYPSKTEHGAVVPTWNYELIHFHGRIEVHDDAGWLRRLVGDLTDVNEASTANVGDDGSGPAWSVDDAPADYIDKQLRAIVGIEFHVDDIQAKRKLSQNKAAADRDGAASGLASSARSSDRAVAAAMESA